VAAKSLKAYALYLLARRDYSTKGLHAKLMERIKKTDALEGEVMPLLEYLKHQGFLSDERFIENYIQSKRQRYGINRISRELTLKVGDGELVNRILMQLFGVDSDSDCNSDYASNQVETAYTLWAKKFKFSFENKEQARQIRFLLYRGFSLSVIKKVLALAKERES
jgi:regulatory protein